MTAAFRLEGLARLVLMVKPESEEERLLLAAFMRYDENAFTVTVTRDAGHLDAVTFWASDAS